MESEWRRYLGCDKPKKGDSLDAHEHTHSLSPGGGRQGAQLKKNKLEEKKKKVNLVSVYVHNHSLLSNVSN